jgi:hypothetical protein
VTTRTVSLELVGEFDVVDQATSYASEVRDSDLRPAIQVVRVYSAEDLTKWRCKIRASQPTPDGSDGDWFDLSCRIYKTIARWLGVPVERSAIRADGSSKALKTWTPTLHRLWSETFEVPVQLANSGDPFDDRYRKLYPDIRAAYHAQLIRDDLERGGSMADLYIQLNDDRKVRLGLMDWRDMSVETTQGGAVQPELDQT